MKSIAQVSFGALAGRDLDTGQLKAIYRETGTVDLSDSPVPHFDLLKLDHYAAASRWNRREPSWTPRAELDASRRAWTLSVLFIDDNLIGDRPRARELLAFPGPLSGRPRARVQFRHRGVAGRGSGPFRAANFTWVFIGVESPDPAGLRETGKTLQRLLRVNTSVFNVVLAPAKA